jgi:hypothetical protein
MISKILNSKLLKDDKGEVIAKLASGLVFGFVFGLAVFGLVNLFQLIPKEFLWIFLLITSILIYGILKIIKAIKLNEEINEKIDEYKELRKKIREKEIKNLKDLKTYTGK